LSIFAARAVRVFPAPNQGSISGEEPFAWLVSPSHDRVNVLLPLTPDGDALAAQTV